MEMVLWTSIAWRTSRDIQALPVSDLRPRFSKAQILERNELRDDDMGKMYWVDLRGQVVSGGNELVRTRLMVLSRRRVLAVPAGMIVAMDVISTVVLVRAARFRGTLVVDRPVAKTVSESMNRTGRMFA